MNEQNIVIALVVTLPGPAHQPRKCLAGIDRRLASVCDTVIEAAGGNFIIHKGDLRI